MIGVSSLCPCVFSVAISWISVFGVGGSFLKQRGFLLPRFTFAHEIVAYAAALKKNNPKLILKIILFISIWLCWVVLAALMGFSLVAVSRGYSLVVAHWHLIAVASLVAALRLWSTDSVVVAHRLSCSAACGIFLDQGLNPSLVRFFLGYSF